MAQPVQFPVWKLHLGFVDTSKITLISTEVRQKDLNPMAQGLGILSSHQQPLVNGKVQRETG